MQFQPASELTTLYDTDYYRWLEQTVILLQKQDFQHLDLVNLIEEVEGLAGRDRRELQSRLTTLFEHALKRKYVDNPYDYRGWASTIKRTQIEINKLLKDSPSLESYFLLCIDECYGDALAIVTIEHDIDFPKSCPFPTDIEQLLNDIFWE
ncbi:hypothetical protein GlitD10_2281 [Gloeomargarita lithophora Alchichica-D10]|uniref:DUF29 domain-containing protein n=1 Tax=Gloeomargarita lithophora Alchichica-D10 TaxID=1188229 RepID=A0A1J0AFB4_9CYAN|nr:DUF29 domain-containing protein [Gloeomargarita lithophora]APB34613.1 hypothetical protein GlitD10_2281 [Gloeomargarita lithophora Alchichica-D10]